MTHPSRRDMLKSTTALAAAFVATPAWAQRVTLPRGANNPSVTFAATPSSTRAYVNLSELHYRPTTRIVETQAEWAPLEPTMPVSLPSPMQAPRATRVAWNSSAGRKLSADKIVLQNNPRAAARNPLQTLNLPMAISNAAQTPAYCTEPHVTMVFPGAVPWKANYVEQFYDDGASNVTNYFSVGALVSPYNDETAARDFASKIPVSMPFFLPFQNANVGQGSGWFYSYAKNNMHAAVDYGRSDLDGGDPTFAVHAVAGGKVVAKTWDDRVGNSVIIEHTAPNGDRYRSHYCHLRDGYDHDLALAQAMPISEEQKKKDADGNYGRPYKYYLFARLEMTDDLKKLWGTNEQAILVETGDNVYAGQQIAWSGNTGWGGAGWGVENDGKPSDPKSGNNHLHLYFSYLVPGTANWVLIDPYGVYSDKGQADCYELTKTTLGPRVFAPFLPAFHNVPLDVLLAHFGYYPSMGYGLQTLSIYDTADGTRAAGAFLPGLPPQWYTRVNMTAAEMQQWYGTYRNQGMRPREISVVVYNNTPYFTVTWQKSGGESEGTWAEMDDNAWMGKWKELVEQGHMRVEDHFVYTVNGQNRHAAIYVGDGNPAFYEYHYMSDADAQAKFNELNGQGFRLTSVNVLSGPSGKSIGGVWRPMPGSWYAFDLSAPDYQAKYLELVGQGYNLYKVQGYDQGNRFAAIWRKA